MIPAFMLFLQGVFLFVMAVFSLRLWRELGKFAWGFLTLSAYLSIQGVASLIAAANLL